MRKALILSVALLMLASVAGAQHSVFTSSPDLSRFAPAGRVGSRIFYVDPQSGNDANSCLTVARACASVQAAFDKTVTNRGDTVIFLAGPTADAPTATILWDKDFTHLVGVGCEQPGMGNRCRIVGTDAVNMDRVLRVTGSGNIFRNIQVFQGNDATGLVAWSGAVCVEGSRNVFQNVFFAGMGHADAAAEADSYSLMVTGAENYFENCTIGLDTIARTAANSELHVAGARNRFVGGEIRSNSTTAGKFLVRINNTAGDLRETIFRNVLFFNYTTNWANGIDDVFNMPVGGNTHYVILQNCQLVGVNSGWADVVTRVYSDGPAPNAGFGISLAPTT